MVIGAIPTIAFQIGSFFPDWRVWIIGVGVVLFLALVLAQALLVVRKARAEEEETSAQDEIRITMKRALSPIATLLAEMPNLPPSQRRSHLRRVSDRAAVSLADYLLRHVPDVRATVFFVNDDATILFPVSHAGAGDPARPFDSNRKTVEPNLAWVQAGGNPRRVDNLDSRSDYDPTARYRSYIAVVIRAGTDAYGMVTVDSPVRAGFSSTDVETVSVIAGFLACACAMAYPGISRPILKESRS